MRRHRLFALTALTAGLLACSGPPSDSDATPAPAMAQEPAPSPVPSPTPPTMPATLLAPDQYTIQVDPTVLDNGSVRIAVATNIPGTIEAMASVELAGQKPNDLYVGKTELVRIVNGSGSVTIGTAGLPKGSYEAQVNFYPRWGFQDSASRATGINNEIHSIAAVRLGGTREAASTYLARKEGHKWVAMNLGIGDPWRESDLVRRFGSHEELPVEGLNPAIIKAYYFPSIDTTIFANVLTGEVSHWRSGRANS